MGILIVMNTLLQREYGDLWQMIFNLNLILFDVIACIERAFRFQCILLCKIKKTGLRCASAIEKF
jgi:hypothetical protein